MRVVDGSKPAYRWENIERWPEGRSWRLFLDVTTKRPTDEWTAKPRRPVPLPPPVPRPIVAEGAGGPPRFRLIRGEKPDLARQAVEKGARLAQTETRDEVGSGSDPQSVAWVALAMRGDRASQEALFRRHYARVRRRVARLFGPRSEIDDVVQDTFLKAFQELRRLEDPRAFGAWVLTIAVHAAHRRLRRARLLRRLGFVGDSEAGEATARAPSHGASPSRLAEARAVYALLDRLPTETRIAFLLRRLEGLTVAEVAREMRLSERTVKRRVAAAERTVSTLLNLEVGDTAPAIREGREGGRGDEAS